mgnify:FL=1
MAEAKLNFNEDSLDKKSSLYDLYSRFYQGMTEANKVDAPDYSTNPPLNEDGSINNEKIAEGLAEYSNILMKNSAYMMANAIISSVSSGGSGGSSGGEGLGYISRSGDSMTGMLGALYGFQAGYDNKMIFDTTIDASDKKVAHVYGNFIVDESATVRGKLSLSDNGLYFGDNQTIWIADNKLNFAYQDIQFAGEISIDGSLSIGNFKVTQNGVTFGDYEFYHSGNCNNKDTNWAMKDAHVYGDLTVDGSYSLSGKLSSLYGFELGEYGNKMLYSVQDDADNRLAHIALASDLVISPTYGIKFGSSYVIKVRGGEDSNIISIAAPGKVMNLGDSDGETKTTRISLQTEIWDYNSAYRIVSQYGDGHFRNSLEAGCSSSGDTVLRTYHNSDKECGVAFYKKIRLGKLDTAPNMYTDDTNTILYWSLPYIRVVDDNNKTEHIPFSFKYIQTESLFKNQSSEWSATLELSTEAEFFRLGKPVESTAFSISSEKYKTRLAENVLYFADAVYLEGVVDGLKHQGNSYYIGTLSSQRFASGFAGYGWAIANGQLYGGYAATFDELTVRKKMHIYELEVQKISVTNGSLWVSDACSGDIVEEVL